MSRTSAPRRREVRISLGAPHDGRSERAFALHADAIRAGRSLLIVPSPWRAHLVQRSLAAGARASALLDPLVMTFADAAARVAGAAEAAPVRVIGEAERLVIAETLGRDPRRPSDDPAGRSLARSLAGAIAEARRGGADATRDRVDAIPRVLSRRARAFVEVLGRYEDVLVRHGATDREALPARAAAALAARPGALAGAFPRLEAIVLDGFGELRPGEVELLAGLVEHGDLAALVLADRPTAADEVPELAPGVRPAAAMVARLGERFGGELIIDDIDAPSGPIGPAPTPRRGGASCGSPETGGEPARRAPSGSFPAPRPVSPVPLEAADRLSEVEAIARDVKRRLLDAARGSGRASETVAVVFPKLDEYAALVREVFPRFGLPFHVSVGPSIGESGFVRTLALTLDVIRGQWRAADVVALLGSPLVSVWVKVVDHEASELGAASARRLDAALVAEVTARARVIGGPGRGIADWERGLGELAGDPGAPRFLRAVAGPLRDFVGELAGAIPDPGAVSPAGLVEGIAELVDRLGMRRALAQSARRDRGTLAIEVLAREARSQQRALDTVAELAAALARHAPEPRPLEHLRGLLRALWVEQRLPGDGAGAQAPVQVMGLLETRGQRFDHVVIGGLTDEAFPRRRGPDPLFEPSDRERARFLDHPRRTEEEDALLFAALLRAARRSIVVSRPVTDGDATLLPAAVFTAVTATSAPAVAKSSPEPLAPYELDRRIGRAAADLAGRNGAAAARGALGSSIALPARGRAPIVAAARPGMATASLAEVAAVRPAARAAAAIAVTRNDRRALSDYDGVLRGGEVRALATASLPGSAERPFSASSLETYALCPFRFFANKVLSLREPEVVSDEITAIERGDLVHAVMFRFYTRWKERRGGAAAVAPEDRDEASALLLDEANRALADDRFGHLRGPLWAGFRERLLRGLPTASAGRPDVCGEPDAPGLLLAILDREIDEAKKESWIPTYFEWEFGRGEVSADPARARRTREADVASVAGALRIADPAGPDGAILLRGQIDRIDLRIDESLDEVIDARILDYKTGSPKETRKDVLSGLSYQRPLYLLATERLLRHAGRTVRGLLAAFLQAKDPVDVKLAGKVGTERDPHLLETVEDHVRADVAAMRAGFFPTTSIAKPDRVGCAYCPARNACRTDPARVVAVRDPAQRRLLDHKDAVVASVATRAKAPRETTPLRV